MSLSYGWWCVVLAVCMVGVLALQFVGFYTWPLTIVGLVLLAVMIAVVLWVRHEHEW